MITPAASNLVEATFAPLARRPMKPYYHDPRSLPAGELRERIGRAMDLSQRLDAALAEGKAAYVQRRELHRAD